VSSELYERGAEILRQIGTNASFGADRWPNLPPEQAEIPLIVKSSVPISIEKRAAYAQPDVYDTVLSLLSIQTPLFDSRGSFISRQASVAGG
jgi:hypothetical protein